LKPQRGGLGGRGSKKNNCSRDNNNHKEEDNIYKKSSYVDYKLQKKALCGWQGGLLGQPTVEGRENIHIVYHDPFLLFHSRLSSPKGFGEHSENEREAGLREEEEVVSSE